MEFSELIDVSVTLRPELAVWPGDPAYEVNSLADIKDGAVSNVSQIKMSLHVGTHMDAPRHFLDGTTGVDQFALDALVGPCWVVEMSGDHHITAADLDASELPDEVGRVLFKTRNSAIWANNYDTFKTDYIALAPDGAKWLIERGVKLVGIDYLSIEEYEPPVHDTHYQLLLNRVVILEGLDLSKAAPGQYTLMALPLKILNGDGAPARVVLGR